MTINDDLLFAVGQEGFDPPQRIPSDAVGMQLACKPTMWHLVEGFAKVEDSCIDDVTLVECLRDVINRDEKLGVEICDP